MQLAKQLVLQTAPVSSRGCLHVLPPGPKKTQRIVLGDDAGLVQCATVKRGSPLELDFKTQLTDGKVECIALGGSGLIPAIPAAGQATTPSNAARERMFVSSGSTVRGLNKKGKEFFNLSTNLAEPLRFMVVEGSSIYACTDYSYACYEDGQESSYVGLPAQVQCMVVDRITRAIGPALDVLMGCADGVARVIVDKSIRYEVPLGCGSIQALVPWESQANAAAGTAGAVTVPWSDTAAGQAAAASGSDRSSSLGWSGAGKLLRGASNSVLPGPSSLPPPGTGPLGLSTVAAAMSPHRYWAFGTSNGTVGMISGHPTVPGLKVLWQHRPDGPSPAPVTSLACFDVRGVGCPDLIVGRQDGTVEVLAVTVAGQEEQAGAIGMGFGDAPSASGAPAGTPLGLRLLFTCRLDERVQCVGAGHLTTPGVTEVLAQTFTGRLYSFTTDRLEEKDVEDSAGRSKAAVARAGTAAAVRKEIEELRRQLEGVQTPTQGSGAATPTQSSSSSFSSQSQSLSLARHDASVSWSLDPKDGSYMLALELPCALEGVLVSASMPLDVPGLPWAGQDGEEDEEGGSGPSSTPSAQPAAASPVAGGGEEVLFGGGLGRLSGQDGQAGQYGFSGGSTASAGAGEAGGGASNATLSRGGADGSSARASGLAPPPLVLTARLPEKGNRVWLRVRTVEGSAGEVVAIAMAKGGAGGAVGAAQALAGPGRGPSADPTQQVAPATVVRLPVRPLSLHVRLLEGVPAVETTLQQQWARWLEGHAKEWTGPGEAKGQDQGAVDAQEVKDSRDSRAGGPVGEVKPPGSPRGPESSLAALASVAKASSDAAKAALGPPQPPPMQALAPSSLPCAFPFHTLTITGQFSLATVHEWVTGLLPDVPPRLAAISASGSAGGSGGEAGVALAYRHVLVGSHLLLTYCAGRCVARSDNISTLAVVRDQVSAMATAVKTRVDMRLDLCTGIGDGAGTNVTGQAGGPGTPPPALPLRHLLSLLHSRLLYVLSVSYRAELADAVKEMVSSEPSVAGAVAALGSSGSTLDPAAIQAAIPFLHPLWADVLARGEEYKAAAKARPRLLARLTGVLTDMWLDYQRAVHGREGGLGQDAAATLDDLVRGYIRAGGPEALLAWMERPMR